MRALFVQAAMQITEAQQEAILTEYQNMLARLSTIFAQQKALVTRLSRPLPMTPDDINVVRAALMHTSCCATRTACAMLRQPGP